MINTIIKFDNKLNSRKSLLIVILSIILLNTIFYIRSEKHPFSQERQARKDASGFSADKAYKFVYFFYYTGNFPLATLNEDLEYSREGAIKEIEENGEDLIMEYQHWSRLGEQARILAYLPNAILKGSPKDPSIKLFNALIFTLSLIILYHGFKKINHSFFGLLLVFLINITPFFLYEVYSHKNIFGLMGSLFFIVLGLNLHVLFKENTKYLKLVLSGLVAAILIGFFSEIRNEVTIVLVSLILIYLLSKHIKLLPKFIIILLIVISYWGSKKLVIGYFNAKNEQTTQLVKENNGHIYTGKRIPGHIFWHPIFCGLGDFDTKYGYEWNDKVAYRYAIPKLKEKYNIDIKYSDKYYIDEYYDKDSLYYKKFDEIDEYEYVLKEKVISDIKSDKLWYLGIITKRIIRTLTKTTPVSYLGWLIFPLIYYLIRKKYWDYVKLILITLPLSATSILIYSGKGSTYNSVFVYFVIVICLNEIIKYRRKGFEYDESKIIQEKHYFC
ncbi:MAG: energy-coupling factor transporter transmembrane protein EcfT [Saprospiraceae bacterium]|nr:energy-coupling factor transporter transmembrane protein EcfT [Saprospiraceae bacterium]